MERYQVVIAGAGPVGTVAALYLANHGIRTLVLEATPTCETDLRASTLHPPTLEMLDELGIADTLIEQGLKAPIYQYRNRKSGDIFEFDLSELKEDTKFPFRLQCEQFKLAREIANRLEASDNSDIRFNRRVIHFEQDSKGVTVNIETPLDLETVRADYLIGADGANSIIRKWLGVSFGGFTYKERFLTLSTEWPLEDHFEDLSYVNYISDPDEWLVLLRVPSVWRVLVPIPDDAAPEEIRSDARKCEIFDRLVGDGESVRTVHRTIYNVHQRVADRFDHGRVFIVGDAAHLNNPLGGFGMNSGIHDAWNLCQKLVDVLVNEKPVGDQFELFGRQRRAIANAFVQEQTVRNKKMMEERNAGTIKEQEDQMRATLKDDDLRRKFLLKQSMLTSLQQAAEVA